LDLTKVPSLPLLPFVLIGGPSPLLMLPKCTTSLIKKFNVNPLILLSALDNIVSSKLYGKLIDELIL
jgi:hypothetical protein